MKRQANILSSLISNFETVEEVIETAMDSEGSAFEENAKWMDSIEGKTTQLTNAMQALWNETINSEVIKFFLDLAIGAVGVVDKIGMLPSVLAAVAIYFTAFKKQNPAAIFRDLSTQITTFNQAAAKVSAVQSLGIGGTLANGPLNPQAVNAYAAAVGNLTIKQQASMLASKGLSAAQIQQVLTANGATDADAKLAIAEANVAAAKMQATTVTGAQINTLAQENGVKLSTEATTWLASVAEEELTRSKVKAAVASNLLQKEDAETIISLLAMSGAATGASVAFKGLGAAMKAAFMNNPVGIVLMLITTVISLAVSLANLKKSNEELIQQASELKNAYKEEADAIQSNLTTIQELEAEFNKLSKGVDEYGNNISLATDDYERYREIIETIVGMSPDLIEGYDKEGNAIVNKNNLIQRTIDLMQEEQRLKAKEYLTDKNIDTIREGAVAGLKEDMKNIELPQVLTYTGVLISEDGKKDTGNVLPIEEYLEKIIGVDYKGQGIEKYIQQNAGLIEEHIGDILNLVSENFVDQYGRTWQALNSEQVAAFESYIYAVLDATEEASDEIRAMLQLVPQQKKGYYDLSEATQQFLNQYIEGFSITEDTTEAEIDAMIKKVSEFTDFLINNSEIEGIVETGYKLSIGKDADGNTLSVAEYQKEVEAFRNKILDSNYTDEQKNFILSMFGLDDDARMDNEVEKAIEYVKTLLKGTAGELTEEAQKYIDGLTVSEVLYIRANVSAVLDEDGLSVPELQQKINETYNFDFADYSSSFSAITEDIASYQEALEKLESGTFTMSDYLALIEKFPDLAKGVDISSKSFDGLSTNLKKAIKQSPKALLKDLKQLRQSLLEAGKSTEAIDQVIAAIESMPEDALDGIINKYSTLTDTINAAKVASNELKASMEENPNEGYETRGEAMEYIKDAMARGEIGSESNIWKVAEQYGFTGYDPSDINASADALAHFIAVRDEWFAKDDDGNYTYAGTEDFIKSVEAAVANNAELAELLTWNYDEVTGAFSFDFENKNLKRIIELLGEESDLIGLTVDEFSDMLIQVGQYFGINWGNYTDILDHLNEVAEGAGTAADKVEEYGKLMQQYFGEDTTIDLTNRPVVSGKEMQEAGWTDFEDGDYATTYSHTFSNADGTKSIVVTPILPDGTVLSPYALEYYATRILNGVEIDPNVDIVLAEFDGSDATNQANAYAGALSDAQAEYDTLRDPLNISTIIDTEGIDGLKEIEEVQNTITENSDGVTIIDEDAFRAALKEAGYTEEYIDILIGKVEKLNEAALGVKPIVLESKTEDPLGLNNAVQTIDDFKAGLDELGVKFKIGWDGKVKFHVEDLITVLKEKGWTDEEIKAYCEKLSETTEIDGVKIKVTDIGDVDAILEQINAANAPIVTAYEVTGLGYETVQGINDAWDMVPSIYSTEYTITETTVKKVVEEDGTAGANGTVWWKPWTWGKGARVNGTAFKGGSWGAPKTETALTGELGPEMRVRDGRWELIGENGAEFTDVKKGDIIFNHKQTEELLKNGHVTGRGKAFAEGTAFASGDGYFARYTFGGQDAYTKYDVNGNIVDGFGDAVGEFADATDEFQEVFDWIEVRLEELDETLGLLEAQLENIAYYNDKNNLIDEIIGVNNKKLENLEAGYEKYSEYANKLLTKVPEQFQEAAQNGAIAITEFVGEADEATLEAIENYREWAQKAADLKQQAVETITAIRDLAIQKFDNAYEAGDVRATVEDSQTEKLQNAVDYDEERGLITSDAYYIAMMENSNKKIEYLTNAREAMQKELDAAVEAGQIERGSNEWYELVDQMYEIDASIDEATMEIEEFQNAINDLYWENFDQLISRIEYLEDETQNLIDLMDNADMVVTPETEDGWAADEVRWTEEGLASLGLYAQQMEIAEFKAKQYAEAIDDLNKDYADGKYSENEYLEKLEELTSAQYDSIEAYHDAQDAIVDLNKTRIDSIKNGIEKEIDAYEKLIKKQKEQLSAEKDLYDFQKDVTDQQKNIAQIERQLAALANDNSLSAMAKRKQLESELAEANYNLQDTYYNRSVEDQQNALDKELEAFQEEKEAEITKWEEYLDNVELIVAESLNIVQANASAIGATLTGKAEEYNLTVSDAILSPWEDGALAVSDYQYTFDTAMSSTMDQLEALKNKWQEVIDKMAEVGDVEVAAINQENENYVAATYQAPVVDNTNTSTDSDNKENYIIQNGDNLWDIAEKTTGNGSNWKNIYNDNKNVIGPNPNSILPGTTISITQTRKKKDKFTNLYAKGTSGVKTNQLAIIDELGLTELVMHAGENGRLQYLTKGTAVIPHDISENLMELGQLDPSEILNRSTPRIGMSPSVVNNTVEIHMDIAEVVHIDTVENKDIPDLTKAIEKQMDQYMQKVNNSLKRFTR